MKLTPTSYFAYCGSGGGALGFKLATIRLLGQQFGFRVLGGFDLDKTAVANFRTVTGVEALCADVREITPAMLRESAGGEEPDVVFGSAPCVGASKLITDELAETEKYRELNSLTLVWTRLMLETWRPRIIIYENVPNVVNRAKGVIAEVRKLLRASGYLVADGAHELGEYGPPDAGGQFYDAGVLGGLAQRRKRWLLVARDPSRCAPLLYKPPRRRVRGIGEVIGPMPLPEDPAGGPMHKLPRLSAMNWIRLALIPAGGDWRDLPGVLAQEQERREVHRRQHLARWTDPSVTVGGPGSNGPYGVADPRVPGAFGAGYGVTPWGAPSGAVIAEAQVPNGRFGVADPRVHTSFDHAHRVIGWQSPAGTVTSSPAPSSGAVATADPRVSCEPRAGTYGVIGWGEAATTVTGSGSVDNGRQACADPRVGRAFDKGYAVIDWASPANTIAGCAQVGCGTYSVADPRPQAPAGWLTVDDVMVFLETPGPWAIVDRASDGPPIAVITDLRKPAPIPLRIVARDGTWHRPLTTLELAVLQGLPWQHEGAPLRLTGPATTDRKHIGNLVPPPAAMAIAEQMLVAIGQHELGTFTLSGGGSVWVEPVEEALAC